MLRYLQHLYHLLLGAVAGFIVGIIPSLVAAIFSDLYAGFILIACVVVGSAIGVMMGKNIKWFFDGLLELVTIG